MDQDLGIFPNLGLYSSFLPPTDSLSGKRERHSASLCGHLTLTMEEAQAPYLFQIAMLGVNGPSTRPLSSISLGHQRSHTFCLPPFTAPKQRNNSSPSHLLRFPEAPPHQQGRMSCCVTAPLYRHPSPSLSGSSGCRRSGELLGTGWGRGEADCQEKDGPLGSGHSQRHIVHPHQPLP